MAENTKFKNRAEYEAWKAQKNIPPAVETTPIPPQPPLSPQKKCKHCAMMIPKEARSCPYCRKKQHMGVLGFIGTMWLVGIVAAIFIPQIARNGMESLMPIVMPVVFVLSYWTFIKYSNKKGYSLLKKWGGGYMFASFAASSFVIIMMMFSQERKQEEQRFAAQQAENRKLQAEQAKKRAEEEACKTSLQCWGDKHHLTATFACKEPIEKLAKYDYQWTDSWSETKFPRFRWHDSTAKTLTYIGDKIKFQNGFGAWQHMTYECDYDPINKRVIDARINTGRS